MSITTSPTEQPQDLFRGKRHTWTPEQARKAALKRIENQRALIAKAESIVDQANQSTPIAPPITATANPDSAHSPDEYSARTLTRVRQQMDLLADMMLKETDPARIDRLAAAFAKLAEVERQHAGRPMPGSLRPSNRPAAGGMIEQPQTSAPSPSSAPPVQSEAQE